MITSILDWFNPTRWMILGGVVLALIAGQTGFYFWAKNRGYDQREAEVQQAIAAQREKNAEFAGAARNAAINQARSVDNMLSANARKAQDERSKTRSAIAAALPQCVPNSTSSGVSSVPDAGAIPDVCARAADAAVENYRIARDNADKVTALQAHIERSRKGYNEATKQKDDRPVSDAESRWTALEKQFNERAKAFEGKK